MGINSRGYSPIVQAEKRGHTGNCSIVKGGLMTFFLNGCMGIQSNPAGIYNRKSLPRSQVKGICIMIKLIWFHKKRVLQSIVYSHYKEPAYEERNCQCFCPTRIFWRGPFYAFTPCSHTAC